MDNKNKYSFSSDVYSALVHGNVKQVVRQQFIDAYKLTGYTREHDAESTRCVVHKLGLLLGTSVGVLSLFLDLADDKEKGTTSAECRDIFCKAFDEALSDKERLADQYRSLSVAALEESVKAERDGLIYPFEFFSDGKPTQASVAFKEILNAIFGTKGGEPDAPDTKD